jgi:uncharacterized protein YdhG (YjbR/CyaY superfamily)
MAAQLGDKLKPYTHGKGTIQFPATEPIPDELVRDILRIRLVEVGGSS